MFHGNPAIEKNEKSEKDNLEKFSPKSSADSALGTPSFEIGGTLFKAGQTTSHFPSSDSQHVSHNQARDKSGQFTKEKNTSELAKELKYEPSIERSFQFSAPIKLNTLIAKQALFQPVEGMPMHPAEARFLKNQLDEQQKKDGKRDEDYIVDVGEVSLQFDLDSGYISVKGQTHPLLAIPIDTSIQELSEKNSEFNQLVQPLLNSLKTEWGIDSNQIKIKDLKLNGPSAELGAQLSTQSIGGTVGGSLTGVSLRLAHETAEQVQSIEATLSLGPTLSYMASTPKSGKPDQNKVSRDRQFSIGNWSIRMYSEENTNSKTSTPLKQKKNPSQKGKPKDPQTLANRFTQAYGIKEIQDSDVKQKLGSSLVQYQKEKSEAPLIKKPIRDFTQEIQSATRLFSDVSKLGQSANSLDLVKVGQYGAQVMKGVKLLNDLPKTVPLLQPIFGMVTQNALFGNILSGFAMTQPYLAALVGVSSFVMGWLGKKKSQSQSQPLMQQLESIFKTLQQLRTEMHSRFDHLEKDISKLSDQVDRVYFSLRDLIQSHHQIQIENIGYVSDGLSEDIQVAKSYLAKLIQQHHLKDLNKQLHLISAYHNGEFDQFNAESNSRELTQTILDLEQNWILSTLVSSEYNGAIFFKTDRQNFHFLSSESFRIEESLGYLFEYAVHHFNFRDALSEIPIHSIPNLTLWIPALHALMLAKSMLFQQYQIKFNLGNINQAKNKIEKTITFIQVMTDNRDSLFKSLFTRWIEKSESLNQATFTALLGKIKECEIQFSLSACLSQNWIQFDKSKLDEAAKKQLSTLLQQQDSKKPVHIPLVLLLAQFMGMGDFYLDVQVKRLPPTGHWDKSRDAKRCAGLRVEAYGGELSAQLIFRSKNTTVSILSFSAKKTNEITYHATVGRDAYAVTSASQVKAAEITTQTKSDSDYVRACQIEEINFFASCKNQMIELFSHQMAEKIITMQSDLQSAQAHSTLTESCLSLLQSAKQAAHVNRADTEALIQELQVIQWISLAYAGLIACSHDQKQAIKAAFPENPALLFNRAIIETCQNAMKNNFPTIAISPTNPLRSRLQGVLANITQFYQAAILQNQFPEYCFSFENYCERYRQLVSRWDTLFQLQYSFPEYVKSDNLEIIKSQLDQLRLEIQNEGTELENKYQFVKLFNSNFYFPSRAPTSTAQILPFYPSTQDESASEQVKSESENLMLPSVQKLDAWSQISKDLGFSVERVSDLMRTRIEEMEKISSQNQPVAFVFGKTGAGKSTLVNHLSGVDYALDFSGGDYTLTICNQKTPIAKTGESSVSVTQYPSAYDFNQHTWIDMPGFSDTHGREEDICMGLLTEWVAKQCLQTRAIIALCTEADLYDTRFVDLRETLMKMGSLFSNQVEQLKKHFVLCVSKPLSDRKNRLKDQYAQQILERLKKWYQDEMVSLPAGHKNEPIKALLSHLTNENILIFDPSDLKCRERMIKQINSLPLVKTTQFHFGNYHASAELFKQFIIRMDQYAKDLEGEVKQIVQSLLMHWQETKTFSEANTRGELENTGLQLIDWNGSNIEIQETRVAEFLNQIQATFVQSIQLDALSQGILGDERSVLIELNQLLMVFEKQMSLLSQFDFIRESFSLNAPHRRVLFTLNRNHLFNQSQSNPATVEEAPKIIPKYHEKCCVQ